MELEKKELEKMQALLKSFENDIISIEDLNKKLKNIFEKKEILQE